MGFISPKKESNFKEENKNKKIELKDAQEKIKEMEATLKNMNKENYKLKGKLEDVISNCDSEECLNRIEIDFIKGSNNENNLKERKKRRNFDSMCNNNQEYLINHFKNASEIPYRIEDENSNLISNIDINDNNNIRGSLNQRKKSTEGIGTNICQKVENKNKKTSSENLSKITRNFTLGKSNIIFNNENHNQELSKNLNDNKINPFIDNKNPFITNDYENICEKVINCRNQENNNIQEEYYEFNS